MRTTSRVLFLAVTAVFVLVGCIRANNSAPASHKIERSAVSAPTSAPAPASEPKNEGRISEGWIASESGFPLGPGSLMLKNDKLNAVVYIKPVPSESFPGGAINHVKVQAQKLAKATGGIMLLKEIIPIDGLDAAWQPFTVPDSPMVGGFAAKTSVAAPETTLYFYLFKNFDMADPGLPAEPGLLENDFVGIITATDIEVAWEPAERE